MIAVIGDIHGCYNTLLKLYNRLTEKYPNIPVYCVGDLVDRGLYSCEVVEFVIEKNIKFTAGNHDYMFYHYFKRPTSRFAKNWIMNGSKSTLDSYQNKEDYIFKHIEVIKSAPLFFNLEDCFICHAGISENLIKEMPEVNLDYLDGMQSVLLNTIDEDYSVVWNRAKLANIGKLQILGHTRQENVRREFDTNSLYIDTGAFAGNKLSAVIIDKNELIEILEVEAFKEDLYIKGQ